jgi:hypothetical protein
MKKNYILMLSALFTMAFMHVQAQYYYVPGLSNGNPGNLNNDLEYPVGGGLTTGWTEIQSGGTATPLWSSTANIPFAFDFNGSPVTQYKVSTSGVLTFDVSATTPPTSTNTTIPSASIPDNSVMVWGLAAPGANDKIVTKTFGAAPNRQHWVFFSSYDIPGGNCWTYFSIVLEETTNRIYIVDQRNACNNTGLTLGIQINGTTAVSVTGSPNYNALAGTDPSGIDNVYYTFIQGIQPDRDLAGVELLVDDYNAIGNAPFTIAAEYANFGATTINNATLNYSVNGGAAVSATSNFTLAPNQTTTIQHSTSWTPTATGTYEIKFWTSNPNGSPDQNPGDDTITKTVDVVSALTQRRPLLEVFTSSTCAPCAPANVSFKNLMDVQPSGHYNIIKYQMSWPGTGDPYYTLEGQDRRVYYSVNSVPNMQIDGGWDQHAGQVTQQILNDHRAVPSFVLLDAAYQVNGQTVSTQIELEPLADITGNIRLFAAVFEKSTTMNAKSNGETVFYYVFKKFMTSSNGNVLSNLTSNNRLSFSFDYTFNGSYILPPNAGSPVDHSTNHTVENFNNLGVMVWVQNMSTKQILQSTSAGLGGLNVNKNEDAGNMVKLYPNPANGVVNIDFANLPLNKVDYQVYNMLGQLVVAGEFNNAGETVQSFDAGQLANGHYHIRLTSEGFDKRIKFNVAR